ncbi:MAG: nitrile hydratase subunit alpha [Gammaproteobacteria bacterium]|nr:nitrile hydratase subunit alpha [Gammaproteobacteria bacterium]
MGTPHDHTPPADSDAPLTYHQTMEIAVRELLIEKKIIDAATLHHQVEKMDARSPAMGAKVVARAWVDPEYKQRLLTDSPAACKELGIELDGTLLVTVENTDDVHNAIVCTLCSCYPRNLLGLPPDWYKSHAYRKRVVREPRTVLAEFGLELPDHVTVRVHDSTADMRYLVLPARPSGTARFDQEALAKLVSRDCMIGVAVPHA